MSTGFFIPLTVAFGVACAGAFLLADERSPVFKLDVPGHRSLHDTDTPKGGGLAITLVVLIAMVLAGSFGLLDTVWWSVGAGALMVALISFADDWFDLPRGPRFVVHIVAALVVVTFVDGPGSVIVPGTNWPLPGWLTFVPVVVAVVWITNLYNFMDGMDGLAGGMGVVGFGTLALLGASPEDSSYSLMCVVIAASCGGFLVANFPPAQIFMGDVGSITLGFLAGSLILVGERLDKFDWWVGVLAFAPFVCDATVTIARRIANSERFWEAHRKHFYQRAVQLGWSHRRTTVVTYALMIVSSAAALAAHYSDALGAFIMVSIVAVTYTCIMVFVTYIERSQGRR
jgi:UDP-N-acetylmuramyl pentapeptide phosphotransferase/UDP-N-acetylglucosamine-1-phosphate transferase